MTRRVRLTSVVSAGALLLAGGAGCATRDQYLRLRDEVYDVRRVLAATRSDLDAQQREMQALRGEVDGLRQHAGLPLRSRPLEPEPAPGMPPVPGMPPSPGMMPGEETPPGAAPPAPESLAGRELASLRGDQPGEEEYRTALGFVEQRNYGEAIPRLRSYLRNYPDTPLSDNAQYWIGECYYEQRDFNNAILAFYDVTRRYPRSDKVCPAMLKQGLAFAELGDAADARIVLERLIQAHPECEEANEARARLQSLLQG
jgi:tol-pal system protein YbgF